MDIENAFRAGKLAKHIQGFDLDRTKETRNRIEQYLESGGGLNLAIVAVPLRPPGFEKCDLTIDASTPAGLARAKRLLDLVIEMHEEELREAREELAAL